MADRENENIIQAMKDHVITNRQAQVVEKSARNLDNSSCSDGSKSGKSDETDFFGAI